MTDIKVALVTGAARGIGRAIALQLASSSYHVVVGDLNHAAVLRVQEEIEQAGGNATAVQLDVTVKDSREAALRLCSEKFGRLDTLVNCAGVLKDAVIERMPIALFSSLMAVNLIGPLALIGGSVDLMRRSGGGAIINISSRAWLGTFGSTAYSTAKGGLVGASRSLALELGRYGITVNCIAPGFIETEMTAALPQSVRERIFSSIAVRHIGQPDDIARAVTFLADAPYCTGQVLPVCGGRSIGVPEFSVSVNEGLKEQ